MRSYGQYCGLAKALDVIGDRWSLLIVRELLLRERCRYTDLRHGLPGIATNLLAARLRELEAAGVVEREEAPPPVATTLFRLTERGRQLGTAVKALGAWGAPLLADAPEDDEFRSHWLALPVGLHLRDRRPDEPPIEIEVRVDELPVVIETADGRVRTRPGPAGKPDAVIAGPPRLAVGVFSGRIALDDARAQGLEYEGDPEVLRRVLPDSAPSPVRA
jgi:DNA-binding HxlR family transcriptional regulator